MSEKRVINSNRRKSNYSKERLESKTSLIDKVNKKDDKKTINKSRSSLQSKVNNNTSKKDDMKANNNANNGNKKQSKFRKSFFFRLSKIGRIMLVVYALLIIVFGALIVQAFMQKGKIIYGERQEPVKLISNEQVTKVKDALNKDISDKDSIEVYYAGYRLVVCIDMKDNATVAQAKTTNEKAYKTISGVLPINEYFYSKDKLNNDLYIYSADIIPTNYETKSKFIYQTYQNSKMAQPSSYDLLVARDAKSAKEVADTIEKAKQ